MKNGYNRSEDIKSIQEEIKNMKFSKSISDKNKINNINFPLNSVYNLNLNKKFATAVKLNSTLDEGKIENNINKRVSRAQSTSFKFFKKTNSSLRKTETKCESGSNLKQISRLNFSNLDVIAISKSGKKK